MSVRVSPARPRSRCQKDAELARYLAAWQSALCRLQRAHPARWRVPGLSDEEVRDALILRLLEGLAAEPCALDAADPSQSAWALGLLKKERADLRKRFRLAAAPVDFRESPPLLEHAPHHEQRWLELESQDCREQARASAESRLSAAQRRWLDAMKRAASDGDFFAASDELNLSAASRLLGKHRSSAQRAYGSLQDVFQDELDRIQ